MRQKLKKLFSFFDKICYDLMLKIEVIILTLFIISTGVPYNIIIYIMDGGLGMRENKNIIVIYF